MDSEEKAGLKFLEYLKILGAILELANQIELLYAMKGMLLPVDESRHDNIALMIVQQAAKSLGEHPRMNETLLIAVDKGADQLDNLSIKAHEARLESDRRLKKQIDDIRELTKYPNCPQELREELIKQLNEVEKVLGMYNQYQ